MINVTSHYKLSIYNKGNFFVEVVESESLYEAWFWYEGYGVKKFLCAERKTYASLESFLRYTEVELEIAKPKYASDYLDGDAYEEVMDTMYAVKDEYADWWFRRLKDKEHRPFCIEEILGFSKKWDVPIADLLDEVEEV